MVHLLADETIVRILSHLDAGDLIRVEQVSKHLRRLAKDRLLWKRLFYFAFVQPAEASLNKRDHSLVLPTLRDLRSLLLHQNFLPGKRVTGDGARLISRLPGRFYSSSSDRGLSSASPSDTDEALTSLYCDGLTHYDVSRDSRLDWEQIYKVSRNWQRGRFAVSDLHAQVPRVDSPSSAQSFIDRYTVVRVSNKFIFAASSTTTRQGANPPRILVYAADAASGSTHGAMNASDLHRRTPLATISSPKLNKIIADSSSNPTEKVHVTEIAVDAAVATDAPTADATDFRKRKSPGDGGISSVSAARILVAYSTGHLSLFTLNSSGGTVTATEDAFQRAEAMTREDHITMAALHFPALVLCSSRFDVAFYEIRIAPTTALNLIHRMSSYRCSWPASLRLKKLPYYDASKRPRRNSTASSPGRQVLKHGPEEMAFRVTLAYSTPSYPSSWSVSVQELVVRLDPDFRGMRSSAQVSSRHATAKHPFRPTPVDLRGRSMLGRGNDTRALLPQTASNRSRSLSGSASVLDSTSSRSTSLTYDDPFVVLGASDNLIEVYELLGATTFARPTPDDAHASQLGPRSATATCHSQRQTLRLVHRRSLHGHTGSVHSVALEDGRCVSGSADGSVMIWSLGERSNETDSIASARRNDRAATRSKNRLSQPYGVGARSTSSTILEEEDGEEAARQMMHVLTLRTSAEQDQLGIEKDKTSNEPVNPRAFGPSLGHIVRNRVLDQQARGVVRWVSTAFDKIVSIVAYPDTCSTPASNLDPGLDPHHPRERVQVWSFG